MLESRIPSQQQSNIVILISTVKFSTPSPPPRRILCLPVDVNLRSSSLCRHPHISCTRETFLFRRSTSFMATHKLLFGLGWFCNSEHNELRRDIMSYNLPPHTQKPQEVLWSINSLCLDLEALSNVRWVAWHHKIIWLEKSIKAEADLRCRRQRLAEISASFRVIC